MGFIDRQSRPQRPNSKFLRWKGGIEKIKNAKGEIEIVGGSLTYYDGETKSEVEVPLPFTFCPLEQTSSVGGFIPGVGRITSNEVLNQRQALTVRQISDNNSEIIASGKWADIKDAVKGRGGSFISNVYAYVPEWQEIVVIAFRGGSLGAFFEFAKKNDIYGNPVIFSEEIAYRKTGKIEFAVPTLVRGDAYDKEQINLLTEKDNQVKDYLKTLNRKDEDGEYESDNIDVEIDQTPEYYDGEQSQDQTYKTVEEAMGDGTEEVDLSEIPF